MKNEQRSKIHKKIQALLAKTTENGATEHESISALQKAKDLMMQHMLSDADFSESSVKSQIIERTVKLRGHNTIYSLPSICVALCKLFDTQYYYYTGSNHIVYIFGMEDDVDLTEYFLQFITKQLFTGINEYRKTPQYKELKNSHGISARRLHVDFSKGFINRISYKIEIMYKARFDEKHKGLIVSKAGVISDEFDKKHKPRVVTSSTAKYRDGYEAGKQRGDETELVQGLNKDVNVDDMLQLNHDTLTIN